VSLPRVLPRVLLLTDRSQLPPGRDLCDTLRRCADVGLGTVVLRELDLPKAARGELAGRVAELTGAAVVTARTWFPGMAGVHLAATQTGLDARPAPFHGRSCHDEEEVRRAVGGGASYLTVSPVAESASKPGHGPALTPAGVRRAAARAGDVPVFALGGVDEQNTSAMRDAGAYGVAVMGAVMRADDPADVLRRIIREAA
jgi:thiamine-phosphate pyrophosphorylase